MDKIKLITVLFFFTGQSIWGQTEKLFGKLKNSQWILLNSIDTAEVFVLDTLFFLNNFGQSADSLKLYPDIYFDKDGEFHFSFDKWTEIISAGKVTYSRINKRGRWILNKKEKNLLLIFYEVGDINNSDKLDDWIKKKEITYSIINLNNASLILVRK